MSTLTKSKSQVYFLEDRDRAVSKTFFVDIDKSILEPEGELSRSGEIQYSGINFIRVKGIIWEFELIFKITLNDGIVKTFFVPVIIIDSDHGKTMLASQFKFGSEARNLYRICVVTLHKLIRDPSAFILSRKIISEIFLGDIYSTLECLILDSGKILSLAPFFKDLESIECSITKQPNQGNSFFTGTINGKIDWKKMNNYLLTDSCIGSGIDMVTATTDLGKYLQNSNDSLKDKTIVINSIFISSYGLKQFLPDLLLAGAKILIIAWEGIFNLFKRDLNLFNSGVISRGNMISIYENSFNPYNPVIVPKSTYKFLNDLYPVEIKPDLNGPVSKRLRGQDIDVITHMILMFKTLNMPFNHEYWKKEISRALSKSPGARKNLKIANPLIYQELVDCRIITTNSNIDNERIMLGNFSQQYQSVELI